MGVELLQQNIMQDPVLYHHYYEPVENKPVQDALFKLEIFSNFFHLLPSSLPFINLCIPQSHPGPHPHFLGECSFNSDFAQHLAIVERFCDDPCQGSCGYQARCKVCIAFNFDIHPSTPNMLYFAVSGKTVDCLMGLAF
jgi:hypothetical protein